MPASDEVYKAPPKVVITGGTPPLVTTHGPRVAIRVALAVAPDPVPTMETEYQVPLAPRAVHVAPPSTEMEIVPLEGAAAMKFPSAEHDTETHEDDVPFHVAVNVEPAFVEASTSS